LRKENDDEIALAKTVVIRATSDIFQPPWRFELIGRGYQPCVRGRLKVSLITLIA